MIMQIIMGVIIIIIKIESLSNALLSITHIHYSQSTHLLKKSFLYFISTQIQRVQKREKILAYSLLSPSNY
jgi:hypothetical protein